MNFVGWLNFIGEIPYNVFIGRVMFMENNNLESYREEKVKKWQKRYVVILLLVILLMGVTVGYSVLSTSLTINGVSHIVHNISWDVHFENIRVTDGSVEATLPPVTDYSGTKITYAIDLAQPGDFYEFTVDVVNNGDIDAELDDLPILSGLSEEQDEYINYTVGHADDSPVIIGELIHVGKSRRFKVRIEIDDSISALSLPEDKVVLNLSVDIPYEQA